jgi:DNA-binding CsgD family transcriptional regulator
MWGIFGKSKKDIHRDDVIRLNQNVSHSFSKVDKDMYHVGQWIKHLHEKNTDLEMLHSSHVELTRNELSSINRWIKYLHDHSVELRRFAGELTFQLKSANEYNVELKKRLDLLEQELSTIKGHLRTQDRTRTGQGQDTSIENIPKVEHKPVVHQVVNQNPIIISQNDSATSGVLINKSALNGAQLELVRILYDSDRPLSYSDLAKILNKKGKSIRNLIYEIRDKGVNRKQVCRPQKERILPDKRSENRPERQMNLQFFRAKSQYFLHLSLSFGTCPHVL